MVIVFLAMILFTSCKKNTDIAPDAGISKSKIELLAQKFTEPIGPGSDAFQKEFAELNEADLKTFFLAVYKIDSKNNKAAMTEQEYEKLFDQVNSAYKAEFNKPFNKLEKADIVKAVNSRESSYKSFLRPPPTEDPHGCGFYNYPIFCPQNQFLTPSGPHVGERIVDYYLDDCNGLEIKYLGNFNRLVPITERGRANLNFVIASFDGTYTYTLHKVNMTNLFFNCYECGGLDGNIRMGWQATATEEKQ